LNVTLPISAASAILSLVLALQAYHAFKYAKKDYLLNFSAGFLLLGLSFIILLPLALGVKLPGRYGDADDIVNYPVFALMQTVGYALIALAYSQTPAARKFLVSLIGFLVVLVTIVLLPHSIIPSSVYVLFYLLNTGLLSFVLYHMLKLMPPTHLVFTGFLLLTLHEYTALIGAVNESIYNYPDDASFLIADLLRLTALCMLFVSFLVTRRMLPSIEAVGRREVA
jgi:hypothetical protein